MIQTFTCGPFGTNCYVTHTSIIDAPPESFEEVNSFLKKEGIVPTHLLITHSHWDHTADSAKFKKAYPEMLIACHPKDQKNLEHPGTDGLPMWIQIEGVKPDILLKEGVIVAGFQVIDLPGHTPGGVGFYNAGEKVLFSGDTLFQGTIGNLSFPTAEPEMMWKSLKKLAKLPADTLVLPGHGDPTTIGQENWLEKAEQLFG